MARLGKGDLWGGIKEFDLKGHGWIWVRKRILTQMRE